MSVYYNMTYNLLRCYLVQSIQTIMSYVPLLDLIGLASILFQLNQINSRAL
jgi:hypothetical protein